MLEGSVRIELTDPTTSLHVVRTVTIRVTLDVGEAKPYIAALETARKTLEATKRYGNG